jgi:serine/threonine protein kinase
MSYDETTGDSFAAGTTFAGVVIERELGRGGAGVVYLARDQQLDRLVALKVLHRHSMGDDPAALDRFRNEAIIAAKLEHPSIIPIYSSGVDRGLAYLVMRYVPGRNLASYLNEAAPMEADAAIRLLRPVAVALDYAAEFNVVHRDVKPANIFVDESGAQPRALLGDFGIARAYEGTRHTATGGWVGTPDYIAPEVLKDEQATTRADQYSLACVLVECLTGVSPFKRSNTAATITAQVTETPDFEALTNVSPRVADALSVALEKNPDDRYTSCTEFLDAISTSATGDASTTPATIVRRRKRSKAKRRAKIIGTVVVTTLGLLLGIAQVTGFNAREWLRGDANAGQGVAVPGPAVTDTSEAAAATAKQPDVLILGSSLSDDWSEWKPKKGVTLPEIVAEALAQNPKTVDYRVKIAPLKSATTCAADVKALRESMPLKAIVVLESPCSEQVVKFFGATNVTTPPIYVLSAAWSELEIAQSYVPHAPSAEFPNSDPSLAVTYGDIARDRFVPLQLPLREIYEAGVVARHYGATRCVYVGSSTDFGHTLHPGTLQAGLATSNTGDQQSVTVSTLPDGKIPRDYMVRALKEANADCLVTNIRSLEISDGAGVVAAWKAAVTAAPDTLFVTFDGGPRRELTSWIDRQPNVVMTFNQSWLPTGPPQDRFQSVGDATIKGWDDASLFDDRAALFFVADVIAGISSSAPAGEIASRNWVAESDSGEERANAFAFNEEVSGLIPTTMGFASGYSAVLTVKGFNFYYVGGTHDSDLSEAPALLPKTADGGQ